jgi:hypothetical protein
VITCGLACFVGSCAARTGGSPGEAFGMPLLVASTEDE